MKLYRTTKGLAVEQEDRWVMLPEGVWDRVFQERDPGAAIREALSRVGPAGPAPESSSLLAPIEGQEVWAAGVTYYRSRDARMEESRPSGADDFYARVYDAERPELFFKAAAERVVRPGGEVRIRRDSHWNVPEPELTLAITSRGRIFGFTISNDMSSRDIEGENPLYLPQAKLYDGCCALGPGILVTDEPLPETTSIRMKILRGGDEVFAGETDLRQLKRKPAELVEYLFRESSFPRGCFLLTGTGIVPPSSFTLHVGDEVRISIEPIGELVNVVGTRRE